MPMAPVTNIRYAILHWQEKFCRESNIQQSKAVLAAYQCSINAVASKFDCNNCKLYQMHAVETIHCTVRSRKWDGKHQVE